MHAILASNPGSTVSLNKDWLGVEWIFKLRNSVFFDANRRRFFGVYMQLIGIDSCFLKGLYKGVLLSAVSVGANYCIYPLVVYVVENEKTVLGVFYGEFV